jgi:ubiquinone/menaquinone biosynthesis C-methylase UbiE
LDSCKFFLQLNRDQNRAVIDTDLRKVPAEDSIVECAFSRHTFEHQDCFETILSEMIRIGKKEAMHIFFIQPRDKTEINYDAAIDLYHNH